MFLGPFNVLIFLFYFMDHCEVNYKNNYVIYTNLFLMCNSLEINYVAEVSNLLELIYYFL